MSKIEQYKEKKVEELGFFNNANGESWKRGFDAAIGLDLPVLFAEWQDKHCQKVIGGTLFKIAGKEGFHSIKSICQYWLTNIYNPEL